MSRILAPGMFLVPDEHGRHRIGGPHDITGADCINCQKPLMTHLLIDTADPLLPPGLFPFPTLPLLYCARCVSHRYNFSYRLRSETTIDMVEVTQAPSGICQAEWQAEMGAARWLRRLPVRLCPQPPRLQELFDKFNDGLELTAADEREITALTRGYTHREKARRRMAVPICQLLGRSFLMQCLPDPPCPVCCDPGPWPAKKALPEVWPIATSMFFLASLYNTERMNIEVTHPGMQVVFFYCPQCHTISVEQSIS